MAISPTILLAEDDPGIRNLLREVLNDAGFRLRETVDGPATLAAIETEQPDLLLLDVGLPHVDGFDVLGRIRETSSLPIIVLTGRDAEADRINGFELGADDYVVKPFYPNELVARIRNVLRLTGVSPGEQLRFGDLEIRRDAHQVLFEGEDLGFTNREFELIAYLAGSTPAVSSRDALLEAVWGSSSEWQDPATVTEHIRRIRLKLGTEAEHIATIRGAGYRFDP